MCLQTLTNSHYPQPNYTQEFSPKILTLSFSKLSTDVIYFCVVVVVIFSLHYRVLFIEGTHALLLHKFVHSRKLLCHSLRKAISFLLL
jgi:hypothetical protein